jgi:spermidine synthase
MRELSDGRPPALGRHILVEFTDCNPEILDDVAACEGAMIEAAKKSGATVLGSNFHHFSPIGVSGMVVIQESHLALHTWPEYGYAAVDLFTCGGSVDPWLSFDHLKNQFHAKTHSVLEMYRGSLSLLERTAFYPKPGRTANHREETRVGGETDLSHFRSDPRREQWFTERGDDLAVSIRMNGPPLATVKSPYQELKVFESQSFGRVLTSDGVSAATEKDEARFHEMLIHPTLQWMRAKKMPFSRALVLGGGDGCAVRELLRYSEIKQVTVVERDFEVIRLSRTYFSNWSVGLDSPRVELSIESAQGFLSQSKSGVWDLIVVDLPIDDSVAVLHLIMRHLTENGVVVFASENPSVAPATVRALEAQLAATGWSSQIQVGVMPVPSYPGGMGAFVVVSSGVAKLDTRSHVNCDELDRFSENNQLQYYCADTHFAGFAQESRRCYLPSPDGTRGILRNWPPAYLGQR